MQYKIYIVYVFFRTVGDTNIAIIGHIIGHITLHKLLGLHIIIEFIYGISQSCGKNGNTLATLYN